MNKILLCLTAGLIVAPPALTAQEEQRDVHVRNDCRLAAQIIRTGEPAPHREWAYGAIRACDQTGGPALAAAWTQTLPSDRDRLAKLAGASRHFPTRELFNAVRAVAEDPGAGTTVRVYALGLLASFAQPGIYLDMRDLLEPRPGRLARTWTMSGDAALNERGELVNVLPEVRALLDELRSADDAVVANAARSFISILP
ncbi:hypothetical protein [Longimicrobium sp.]|uniref:hypothetical protein n=1 Tax=Longimicrobium sp. TaxID=2029185 RepID=UPI003B3A9E8D